MDFPDYFISCDWGTSNFRLRVVNSESLQVVAEHVTDQGIRDLYSKFLGQKKLGQKAFFVSYLKEQVRKFPEAHRGHLIVCSGMGSSNMGLVELPYAQMPFDQSGGTLVCKKVPLDKNRAVWLISGVQSDTGMMRGEEIQAIGLEEYLAPYNQGTLLLPGTHCKHIAYASGQFYGLKNFMTGELFEVLSRKSILANSLHQGPWDADRKKDYLKGLYLGLTGHLSENLLTVRARHILAGESKKNNYFYLSGLLIGDELSYLKEERGMLFLAGSDPVFGLYKNALEYIRPKEQLVFLDEKALERALLAGQRKILRLYAK